MSRREYPGYKPCGVEWIGDIPEHWGVVRFKYFMILQRGHDLPTDQFVEGPYPVCGSNGVIGYHNQYTTIGPSITVGRSGSVGEVNYFEENFWAHNTALYVKIFIRAVPKFAYYLLKTLDVKYLSEGTAVGTLNRNYIHDLPIPLPSPVEQTKIATHLDRETGRIDTLMEKKQRQIELLQEKRAALISQTVTRGLDPSAPLKDSGVEWLGEVPEHWEALPIKRITIIPVTDGPHETPELLDEGIPFISAEAIKNDKIDFGKMRGFISAEDHARFSRKYRPQRGDIFLIKSGATTGNVAFVDTDEEFSIWSPLAAIRPDRKKALTAFVFFFMKSRNFFQSIELGWSYGTQQNIGMNVIENIPIALPPLSEQCAIAAFLDRETARVDALMGKINISIEKLKEYRTALISAAVTGKIDVRKGVA